MSNIYTDVDRLNARVARGEHREVIGGLWDELGDWQFEFCVQHGLTPADRMLDIGCGSLRGGVRFIAYLARNHYFGTDRHQSLLDAGLEREVAENGLSDRIGRHNLICSDSFEFAEISEAIDFALAQSLFSHLSWNDIRLCLSNLCGVMRPGGKLIATYFEADEDCPLNRSIQREHGITTHFASNPYHYRFSDLQRAAAELPILVKRIGDVSHPRGQYVAEFQFLERASENEGDTRALDVESSLNLRAGEDHYRAYVGPPRRYDFMSSTQFALLHTMGLREEDRVLDVGCGSLRLGRLLIPFLREDRYFGVDPNLWLVDAAIRKEVGMDAMRLKKPLFSDNADFDFSGFDTEFDFIIAQSVATHTGPDFLEKLLSGASATLSDSGVFLFSYIKADQMTDAANGWHYPACVEYAEEDMVARLASSGLVARPIPWFHPAASWIVAAHDERYLPKDEDMNGLSGHVVKRVQDTKGYVFRGES